MINIQENQPSQRQVHICREGATGLFCIINKSLQFLACILTNTTPICPLQGQQEQIVIVLFIVSVYLLFAFVNNIKDE